LPKDQQFNAQAFCREIFLFDAHSDIFWRVDEDGYDILKRNDSGHFDIPRAKQGGLDVVVAAACYDPKHVGSVDPGNYVLRLIGLMHKVEAGSKGRFVRLISKEQFDSFAIDDQHLGFIIGLEGAEPFKGDMKRFERFYDEGMRLLCLTHNANNEISQGVDETDEPFYITGFGWEVIAACEEMGVMVDISHLNTECVKYVLDICAKPFVMSHTACRALCDHRRNILDDYLFEMGSRGCVVGIDFIQPHLKQGSDNMDATIDDVLDHIEHAVEVAGVDAVGLGSDMDIIYPLPKGLNDAASYPAIAAGLHHRGWQDADIAKIMGGNYRRIFSEILPLKVV